MGAWYDRRVARLSPPPPPLKAPDARAAADRRLERALVVGGLAGVGGELLALNGWPGAGGVTMLAAAAGVAWAMRQWWRAVPPRR